METSPILKLWENAAAAAVKCVFPDGNRVPPSITALLGMHVERQGTGNFWTHPQCLHDGSSDCVSVVREIYRFQERV